MYRYIYCYADKSIKVSNIKKVGKKLKDEAVVPYMDTLSVCLEERDDAYAMHLLGTYVQEKIKKIMEEQDFYMWVLGDLFDKATISSDYPWQRFQ